MKLDNKKFSLDIEELLRLYYFNYLNHSIYQINNKNILFLENNLFSYYQNIYRLFDNLYKNSDSKYKKKKEYEYYEEKEKLELLIEKTLNLEVFYGILINYIKNFLIKNEKILEDISKYIKLENVININLYLPIKVIGNNNWWLYGFPIFDNNIYCSYSFLFYETLLHELLHYYFYEKNDEINISMAIKSDSLSKKLTFYYIKLQNKTNISYSNINSYIDSIVEPLSIVDLINLEMCYEKSKVPFEEYIVSILSYKIIEEFYNDFKNYFDEYKGLKAKKFNNFALVSYFKTNIHIKSAFDIIQKYEKIEMNSIYLNELIISFYRIFIFYSIFNNIDDVNAYQKWIHSGISKIPEFY